MPYISANNDVSLKPRMTDVIGRDSLDDSFKHDWQDQLASYNLTARQTSTAPVRPTERENLQIKPEPNTPQPNAQVESLPQQLDLKSLDIDASLKAVSEITPLNINTLQPETLPILPILPILNELDVTLKDLLVVLKDELPIDESIDEAVIKSSMQTTPQPSELTNILGQFQQINTLIDQAQDLASTFQNNPELILALKTIDKALQGLNLQLKSDIDLIKSEISIDELSAGAAALSDAFGKLIEAQNQDPDATMVSALASEVRNVAPLVKNTSSVILQKDALDQFEARDDQAIPQTPQHVKSPTNQASKETVLDKAMPTWPESKINESKIAESKITEPNLAEKTPITFKPVLNQALTPSSNLAAPQDVAATVPTKDALSLGLTHATLENITNLSALIQKKLGNKSTEFNLELHPQDLGRVDVKLVIASDGSLSAHLNFDSPVAQSQFKSQADELRRQLEAQGFNLSENALNFSSKGDQGRGSQHHNDSKSGQNNPEVSALTQQGVNDFALSQARADEKLNEALARFINGSGTNQRLALNLVV